MRRTAVGLALVTLLLIGVLLAGVGLAAAAVANQMMDAAVDRSLRDAAAAAAVNLQLVDETAEPAESESAEPSETPEVSWQPGESDEPDETDEPRDTDEPDDTPRPTRPPRPTATPQPPTEQPAATPTATASQSTPRPTETPEPTDDDDDDDDGHQTPAPTGEEDLQSGSARMAVLPTATLPSTGARPSPTATPLGPLAAASAAATASPADQSASPPPAGGGPLIGDADDLPPEASDTFYLVLDPAGRVLANPRRVTLAGLPDIAAASAALAHGQDWRTVEAGGVRVRLFSKRVTDGEGNLGVLQSGFVLTLHDEQKRQLLLTIALASLAGLLGAGLVSLLVAQRALSPVREAFAAERRFVAAASHELRTPVAVLRAQAELLQREGLVAPAGQSLVGEMLDEADRLGRLVGDLLALSSAEAGAIVLEPRPIEVRDFVARICARVEGMARERGVPIELAQADEQSDAELTVIADPDRLAQLLLIFIDNAIDHSPPGAAVQLLVRPVLRHGQPYVSIGVADRGPGVPLDQRQQIFEPFTRSRGRPRLSHSTGLGLAIARILASRQGAEIQVDDGDGGGAVFSVLLPRRRPPTGNAQRRETTSRPAALPPG